MQAAVSALRGSRRLVLGACLAGVLVTTGGCAGSGPVADPAPTAPTTEASQELTDADLWLSFDDAGVGVDGEPEYADELGARRARVVTANGGGVEEVPGVLGRAVQFPAKCTEQVGCPRAMVELDPDPALAPGAEPFAFGASVWLGPDATSDGSNVVQQGRFDSDGGQWKLQVDGDAGEPSCVVRGTGDPVTVRSRVAVADGTWHTVVCRRDAEGISIEVDGVVDDTVGGTGPITSGEPIRIGSPGVGDGDDQFFGRIDDVFLDVDLDD